MCPLFQRDTSLPATCKCYILSVLGECRASTKTLRRACHDCMALHFHDLSDLVTLISPDATIIDGPTYCDLHTQPTFPRAMIAQLTRQPLRTALPLDSANAKCKHGIMSVPLRQAKQLMVSECLTVRMLLTSSPSANNIRVILMLLGKTGSLRTGSRTLCNL